MVLGGRSSESDFSLAFEGLSTEQRNLSVISTVHALDKILDTLNQHEPS